MTIAMAFICTGLGLVALVRRGEKRWRIELSMAGILREYLAGVLTGGLIIAMAMDLLWLSGAYDIKPGRWKNCWRA